MRLLYFYESRVDKTYSLAVGVIIYTSARLLQSRNPKVYFTGLLLEDPSLTVVGDAGEEGRVQCEAKPSMCLGCPRSNNQ